MTVKELIQKMLETHHSGLDEEVHTVGIFVIFEQKTGEKPHESLKVMTAAAGCEDCSLQVLALLRALEQTNEFGSSSDDSNGKITVH